MTGGSLPAMTFKKIMEYAHQGIELRAIPGIEDALPEETFGPLIADVEGGISQVSLPSRTRLLNRQATQALRELAKVLETTRDNLAKLDTSPTVSKITQ